MTTAQEVQKRNNKAQHLRVIQVEDGDCFVSSEEGLILYKVTYGEGKENTCTCGDFARGCKTDPQFRCKHLLAVLNCETDSEKAKYLEKAMPKLDPRFIVQIDNQDFVKYSGLLDLSHQRRLTTLETDIVQFPTKDNERTVICKAHAKTAFGESFIDFGDANPTNCNSKVAKHLIRIASTRSKARVLRDLTNIGMTCLEELGDLDEVIESEEKGTARNGKVKPFPKKVLKAQASASGPTNGNGKGAAPAAESMEAKEPREQVKEPQKDEKKTTPQPEAKDLEKPGNTGKGKAKAETPPPKMSEAQHRAIMNLSRRRGISVEELEKMANETYGVPLENISPSDASSFIRQLQQSA